MTTYAELSKMIDHSLLKPFFTDQDIKQGCLVAKKYDVASVCVRPYDVISAMRILEKSNVLVTTVIGFPHGANTLNTKIEETKEAIHNGASEIDVVLNIGKLKSEDYHYVENELKIITDFAHLKNVKIKIIFENCYLENKEIIKACEICNKVEVDWIKTSTGYGTEGAKDEDILLMKSHINKEIRIKAAGGIRTLERALDMQKLGCTRIGTTATCEILDRLKDINYL